MEGIKIDLNKMESIESRLNISEKTREEYEKENKKLSRDLYAEISNK